MSRSATKRRRFVVEGTGNFPFDMLRYDACWPADSGESHKLECAYCSRRPEDPLSSKRRVTLLSDWSQAPTEGRWNSFTWRVISQEDLP